MAYSNIYKNIAKLLNNLTNPVLLGVTLCLISGQTFYGPITTLEKNHSQAYLHLHFYLNTILLSIIIYNLMYRY